MRISIKLFNKKEYEKDISQEDYEALKEGLKSNKIGFIEIENTLIKSSIITSIEPILTQGDISFRLPEPKFEKINIAEGMKRFFDVLKLKGLFKDFVSYEEWCKVKEI